MSFCPDQDMVADQVRQLYPRGRAWENVFVPGTYLHKQARALAGGFAFIEQRICTMLDEIFCGTANETQPEWMVDYGLPDECDAVGTSLCSKVAAQGGARCEYFVEVCETAGWVVDCEDNAQQSVPVPGCWHLGIDHLGPHEEPVQDPNTGTYSFGDYLGHAFTWTVTIDVPASLQLQVAKNGKDYSFIGCASLGCGDLWLGAPNPVSEVTCLLERIKPAHTLLIIKITR